MPVAFNPETGESKFLDDSGSWQTAKTAVNPDTKQTLIFDGKSWVDVPESAKSAARRFVEAIPSGAVKGLTGGIAAISEMNPVGGLQLAARTLGFDNELTRGPIRRLAETVEKKAQEHLPQPQGAAGAFGSTAAEFAANPLSYAGPGGVAAKAGSAVLGGLASEAAGQATKGTFLEQPARFVGGMIGGVGPAAATSAVQAVRTPMVNVSADLSRALERDGDNIDAAMQRLTALRQTRPKATLADVLGENGKGLVERIAQTPGAGREIVIPNLTSTQQQQMNRISADLRTLTGSSKSAVQATKETMGQRLAASKPAYDVAMNFNARAVPEIMEAFNRETAQGWGKRVFNSPEFRDNLQTEYGISDPLQAPMMEVIDSWKKSADDLIEAAIRKGENNNARVIGEMKDRVIAVVDQHNPAYPQARAIWAGPSQYMQAIRDGAEIGKKAISGEQLRAELDGMTEANREAYTIGAVSQIIHDMRSDPAKMADRTKGLRSENMREKIAALMPTPEAAEAWITNLEHEIRSSELVNRALRGSPTARRLAEQEQADSLAGELAMSVFTHGTNMLGLAKHFLMSVPNRVRDSLRSKSDRILAEILVTPQGAAKAKPAMETPLRISVGPFVGRTGAAIESKRQQDSDIAAYLDRR